jgi:hypothetical protein
VKRNERKKGRRREWRKEKFLIPFLFLSSMLVFFLASSLASGFSF